MGCKGAAREAPVIAKASSHTAWLVLGMRQTMTIDDVN